MFDSGFCYLICINGNTRYLLVEPANVVKGVCGELEIKADEKSSDLYLRSLTSIISRAHIRFLRGDVERAFGSRASLKLYSLQEPVMEWQTVKRQLGQINHRSVSIIDRVVRTLRDLAYKWNAAQITPALMSDKWYGQLL
jgi:hypothetical protein